MGYEGFSGNESILLHLQSPCRLDQVGAFRPIEREEWVPDAHVHRLADANRVEPGGDPLSSRRLLMWNGDIEVSVREADRVARRASTATARATRSLYVHRGSRRAAHGLRPGAVPRARLPRHPARHDAHLRARRGRRAVLDRASTRPARSRRRTATATATASCSSTRPTHSATSTRPASSRPSTRRASSR